MALQWNFKEKAGTITHVGFNGEPVKFNFYEGNAFMIELYEYEEDGVGMYAMKSFFLDVDHAKRYLAEYADSYKPLTMTIYRNHFRQWKKAVDIFTKTYPDLEIILKGAEE